IPDRFEFSEGLYHFGTKHLGQHLCLRLAVTMLSGDGSPVADNQIGGLVDERAKVANSFDGTEVEVDTRVNAALPEVSIERAIVTMLLEQAAQVAQVGTDLLGRNGGVLPTFPRNRLSWHKGRRAKSGLANLPNQFLFALVVIELHGWSARSALQPRHHSSRFGIGFSLVLAAKLHQQEAIAFRQQREVVYIQILSLHVADEAIVDSFESNRLEFEDLRHMISGAVNV